MTEGSRRLSTENLGKQYGDQWAVRGVDLAIDDLRVVGLIGPSGCGKTTLVRMLNGILTPDEGSVNLFGTDPQDFNSADRQRVGYLPQQPVLFPELSLWENLNFHASIAGVRFRRRSRLNELLDFVDLGEERKKKVHEASGGMQRRLALAAVLVHRPEVLFLDEPTAGIDPILRRRIWERFRDLRDDGTLLIVTTQYVGEAADCDDVGVLSAGRLLSLSTPDELARSAYGGDLIEITTVDPLPDQLVRDADSLEGVAGIERIDTHRAQLVVASAESGLPSIRDWLESRNVATTSVDRPATDYDDVFVRIVERARAEDTELAEAAERGDDTERADADRGDDAERGDAERGDDAERADADRGDDTERADAGRGDDTERSPRPAPRRSPAPDSSTELDTGGDDRPPPPPPPPGAPAPPAEAPPASTQSAPEPPDRPMERF